MVSIAKTEDAYVVNRADVDELSVYEDIFGELRVRGVGSNVYAERDDTIESLEREVKDLLAIIEEKKRRLTQTVIADNEDRVEYGIAVRSRNGGSFDHIEWGFDYNNARDRVHFYLQPSSRYRDFNDGFGPGAKIVKRTISAAKEVD